MPAVRVMAGPPVVRVGRPSTEYALSGFTTMEMRERQGAAAFSSYIDGALPWRYAEQNRVLTNAELWQVYRLVPDVRSSIDGIVRRVKTWDWDILPAVDPSDERYELALEIAGEAKRFLKVPNTDSETWHEWFGKLATDLLVFDALACELVTTSKGKVKELVAIRGGDVSPVVDNKQRLLGYRQQTIVGKQVDFQPEQLMYMNLHGNTTAPGGVPLIETLINEIIALMRQAQHLMKAFDADEIPPGLLYLSGIAGRAAERAVESMRQMKGQDHKLRVLTSANPGEINAKWIEFRHTPKDLALKELVHEVRRVVWRVFGRKPASQGDTESTPRATAEVQDDAEDSDLIQPFLEQFEQKFNARVLPLVVGDPELAALVAFEFDLTAKLSAEEEELEAERDASDMDRGALTVNERRAIRGLSPVEHGDTPLIKSGTGYRPLGDVVQGLPDPNAPKPPAPPGADGGDGEDGVTDPAAGSPDDEDDAPGEADGKDEKKKKKSRYLLGGSTHVDTTRARRGAPTPRASRHTLPPAARSSTRWGFLQSHRGCGCEPTVAYRGVRASDLPSDWQPTGKFKGHRTINLSALGDSIIAYQREVAPLYRQARIEVVAATQSVLGDGDLDQSELASVAARMRDAFDALATKWSVGTESFYRRAARLGRDAAVDFTGNASVVENWEARGDAYHRRAMSFLTGDRGLITDLRDQAMALLTSVVRSRDTASLRALAEGRAVETEIDVAALLGALRQIFESNEHRISNWSGRLVELSNVIFTDGMKEGNGTEAASGKAINWYFEWAAVGDNVTCPTCTREGDAGFRPVSGMQRQPGGDTECRSRCRCVIVFWTEAEVTSGAAVRLSNLGRSRGRSVLPFTRGRPNWPLPHRDTGAPVRRSSGVPDIDELRGWLREHYAGTAKLSAPKMARMRAAIEAGQHADLLVPPEAAWSFRGVQVRRVALARLLGDAGAARGLPSALLAESGVIRASVLTPELARALARTDGGMDRSWTLDADVAVGYASAVTGEDHFPDDDDQKVYGAVIVSTMDGSGFLLNHVRIAEDREVSDHFDEARGATLYGPILREQEVVTDRSVQPFLLVYARWDRIGELAGMVRSALAMR